MILGNVIGSETISWLGNLCEFKLPILSRTDYFSSFSIESWWITMIESIESKHEVIFFRLHFAKTMDFHGSFYPFNLMSCWFSFRFLIPSHGYKIHWSKNMSKPWHLYTFRCTRSNTRKECFWICEACDTDNFRDWNEKNLILIR